MINPETQHFMAGRMGAKMRSGSVDHTPLVTAPDLVVDIILEAAAVTTSRSLATPPEFAQRQP
jgi:hypothetical protein